MKSWHKSTIPCCCKTLSWDTLSGSIGYKTWQITLLLYSALVMSYLESATFGEQISWRMCASWKDPCRKRWLIRKMIQARYQEKKTQPFQLQGEWRTDCWRLGIFSTGNLKELFELMSFMNGTGVADLILGLKAIRVTSSGVFQPSGSGILRMCDWLWQKSKVTLQLWVSEWF